MDRQALCGCEVQSSVREHSYHRLLGLQGDMLDRTLAPPALGARMGGGAGLTPGDEQQGVNTERSCESQEPCLAAWRPHAASTPVPAALRSPPRPGSQSCSVG